jgi:hypothetical protein
MKMVSGLWRRQTALRVRTVGAWANPRQFQDNIFM